MEDGGGGRRKVGGGGRSMNVKGGGRHGCNKQGWLKRHECQQGFGN